jgi:hypothetical protein
MEQMNKAAEEARRRLNEPIYSRTAAYMMIYTALMLKGNSGDSKKSDHEIVKATMDLTDMAREAGERMKEKRENERSGKDRSNN